VYRKETTLTSTVAVTRVREAKAANKRLINTLNSAINLASP
jgi:hypothetical protein